MVVRVKGGRVYLQTSYNDDLRQGAKALGGRWDPKAAAWVFDARDEQRVRDLARAVFGSDVTWEVRVTARRSGDPFNSGPGVGLGGLSHDEAQQFAQEQEKQFREIGNYDIVEVSIEKER